MTERRLGEFDPIAFLEAAVRIPSHEEVDRMREYLCDVLHTHGVEPSVDDAGNVLASRGRGRPHLVLNTHIDTVSPHVPFARDGDAIRGRGSCDAKGPLAAMLDAFLSVDAPPGRVTLAVTPDEETDSAGADALDLDADAYVVGEPTGLDVCTSARGRFEGTITVRGSSAHAAEPESGVNAIRGACSVLDALDDFDAHTGTRAHPELGEPTITVTTIEGGVSTNQVPAECRITVDRRSVPPETSDGFESSLNRYLEESATALDATYEHVERAAPFLEAFETPSDAPIVRTIVEAGARTVRPFTAATEASYFARDAPTVVFGPGDLADDHGAVAHSPREYVRIADVHAAANTLRTTLDSYEG